MDILDGFQKLVSTWRTFSTVQKTNSRHGLCPKISIFVEISIETLDLDTFKVDLDVMDNLDGFQKLVSTRRTFSISISTGLDRRDPQA